MARRVGEFRNPVLNFVARGQEHQGVVADADRHRAGLALLEVLLADQPAVLARAHPQAHRVLVVNHDPVSAEVDPVGIRVLHDHQVTGADIAAAVQLMQERNGELQQVDVLVAIDVFQNRAGIDETRGDRREILHTVAIPSHHVHGARRLRETQGHGQALHRICHARQDPEAGVVTGNIVEQQGRRIVGRVVIDHLGDGTDLEVPIGAVDLLQLAQILDPVKPFAQVLVGRAVVLVGAIFGGSISHCSPLSLSVGNGGPVAPRPIGCRPGIDSPGPEFLCQRSSRPSAARPAGATGARLRNRLKPSPCSSQNRAQVQKHNSCPCYAVSRNLSRRFNP